MAKEIEEYFIKRLSSYLLEYLQDFSQNNMAKFSLGISSNIVLKNLSIKKQALLNFKFPLYIIDGKINSITLNMPLNYKKHQPELIIEGVELLVCTIQEINNFTQRKDYQQQGVENLKKHKLKLWEEQMAKYFEKLSPPNWIQKIVDGIFNNMSITIKQFNFRFCNYSILGYETILRIKLDASIKATDGEFKQNFNNDLNSTYKLIQITKLSVSLKKDPSFVLTKKDVQMILMPIDIEVKYTGNKNYELLTQPIMILEAFIKSPVIFQLNKEQKNYLLKLNEVLSCQEIIQDNFHLRPTKEMKNNYSEWWKYFINSIILKQKSQKLDLSFSSKKLVSMKRYIQLYKRKQNIVLVPWLSQWTAKDETKFKNCEDSLPLKDLLKYREWAFQEIRMEAKRYCNSAKDGQNDQSVKPLLEIWTNTINNQNSFKDHTKRNDDIPIELEDDEKINLYEILERDKTNVLASYLKGENNHPHQLKVEFKLKIHSIFILIFEYREQNFVKYTPDNTKIFKFCQCKYHLKLLKKQGFSRKKVRQSSNVNTLIQVQNETLKQNEDNSFHSARYIDSFQEDMEDLNGVGSEILESSDSQEKIQNFEQKLNAEKPLHQQFVLLISLIGIKVPLYIYQNGGIQTPQHKGQKELEEKIYIGDIKMIAPGILLKIMDEKEPQNYIQSPLFGKSTDEFLIKKKEQNQNCQIKYCEFFNEIFEISVTKDSQQFLNSEICYQTLGEFLKQNKMQNIKSFLDDYERDKNGFQDFTTEQFKAYDKYFDDRQEQEDPLFIHISKQQIPNEKSEKNEKNFWDLLRNVAISTNEKEKQNQWIICENNEKHVFLQEAHNKIVDIIRRVLFIPFIEEFGEMILPTCISNLREKLTFPQVQPKKDQDQVRYALQISLYLRGEEAEYRIVRNNQSNKVNSKETLYQNQKNSISKIKIQLTAITFLLSTKAVTSLLYFSENQKQQLCESQAYQQCQEDHKLLQCIVKSKPLVKETRKQQKLKFSLKMVEKFKIRIVTDSIASKIKTELKVQLKNLFIQTINLDKLRLDKDFKNQFTYVDRNKIDNFFQEQQLYSINKIILEQFQIAHKYFSIDYRYYNEEMRNYEKQMQQQKSGKEQQNSPPLSFQRNSSQSLLKPMQYPLRHAVTTKTQQEQNQQNQFQLKPQNKINGIKSVILESRLLLFKFDSLVENHPLITDKKLQIQIPYFDLQINDSQICLIELLMIINKKLKQKEKKRHHEFRYQMSKDSLMRAELLMLQNDHKKQKKDCKHCILRFRKSLYLSNITFGQVPKIQNDINLFSLFEFENQMIYLRTQQKKIEEQQASKTITKVTFVETHTNSGISIQFKSTPKTSKSVCYLTIFEMPLFIITHDKGYFKDTIAVHCKKTPIYPEMSQSNKLEIPLSSHPVMEKNKSVKDTQSQKPYQFLVDEITETNIEKTHLIFEPLLMVEESQNLSDKLDDKFIFYCRNQEPEMFNHDFVEYEDKDQISSNNFADQQSTKDPIYLLFYFHKPLRANLLINVAEEYYQERHSKIKLFFAIENIKATFINQFATYNLITILKNINTIMNIQENAYNLINKDLLKKEKQKVKLKQNPLKVIDDLIVCAIVQNIYLKSNETFFKLSQLKVFVQIYLMEKFRINPIQKRSFQSYYPQGGNNIQIPKNRSSINYHEEDQILRCDTIKFNFNQVSQVDIKIVLVTKQKGELSLSVDDIQISITGKGKQRENLLVMPVKESVGQKAKYALHINLSFQNSYPLVKAKVEQAKILLSQQKVQDLLIAINSFYLINIEETISLKQHLMKYIFQQELNVFDKEEKQINIFVNQINNQQKAYKFASELLIESLIVKLQEQEQDFFKFQFHSINLNKKNQSNLALSIQQIEMKPQNLAGEQTIYQNLIEPIDNKQTVVFNLENKIISIRNMRLYLISRYINELQAFKQRVEAILQKNLDELKEKYQKDFDLQLQIKHEEDFLKEKDNFNYQIEIQNSQLVLPQTSQDQNFIIATFQTGHITLKKQKIQLKLPEIDDEQKPYKQSFNESLFIDYKEQIQPENGEFYVINVFGCFDNVKVKYQMQNNQKYGELLKADQITANMDIPSFEQNCGQIQWKFKDQCKLEINKLKMSLDLGKLIKIKSFITQNQNELSPLFNFQQPLLQKINFEIKFSDSLVALTRYKQGEPDKIRQIKEKSKVYNQQPRKSKNNSPKNQQH